MNDSHVKVDNLAVCRGDALIFTGLSFEVKSGESLLLKGANGAGKSSALRALLALIPIEHGKVCFSDSVSGERLPLATASHYLGHQNAMKRELTAYDNLVFWRDFMSDFPGGKGMSIEDAADAVDLFDILHLPFGYLSAGQKRRFAFARLFVAHRPVWLLDEPTASLDTASGGVVDALVNRYLSEGGIVIAATHEPLHFQNVRELSFSGPVNITADPFLPEEV